jgi:hypothetical protein
VKDIVDHYLSEMIASIVNVEQSEQLYHDTVQRHRDELPYSGIIAEQRAASHPLVQQAIGDGAFYRSRATMCATAAVAAMLDAQRVKP